MNDEAEYGMVMPFLPLRSKGGPYDDWAYCGGFEMGRLDAALEAHAERGEAPDPTPFTIQAENREQADLIAMRHGYIGEASVTDVPEWVHFRVRLPEQRLADRGQSGGSDG